MKLNLVGSREDVFHPRWNEGISTPRLCGTLYKPGDAILMGEGFDTPDMWQFSSDVDSKDAACRWLEWAHEDARHLPFTFRKACGGLAGFFVVTRRGRASIELGGWLSRDLWGQGHARELLEAIVRKAECFGEREILAEVDPLNRKVCHLLTSAGFENSDGIWRQPLG